jgi:hypothetical protein
MGNFRLTDAPPRCAVSLIAAAIEKAAGIYALRLPGSKID